MGDEPTITATGKPVRTFLKRGEGVQKRVFGPQLRQAQKEQQQALAGQEDALGTPGEHTQRVKSKAPLQKGQEWNNELFKSSLSSTQPTAKKGQELPTSSKAGEVGEAEAVHMQIIFIRLS
jgi:hypothetical protein